MLTFAGKYEVRFMRKSVFYKRVLHTKDGVIPQYCNKEGSYLKVIPHNNGILDSELHIIRKTKRFAIPERAVYFLKTKRTAGGTPPTPKFFDRLTPVFT